ncbi:MAG: CHAT domain-containing protein [Pseudonocardia sp.]|nr:CHAT domain-containing protein [Pseudonocardia sp.]
MSDEVAGELLIQALAAYDGVLGDPQRFGVRALDLVRLARLAGDVESEIVALRAAAWFERSRLANRTAKSLLDDAVALARRVGLEHRQAEALITRSAVEQELGNMSAALRDLERATSIVAAEDVPDLELKRAAILHNTGRLSEAADAYRTILDHHHSTTDIRTRAANNLGLIESLRGRAGSALRYLEMASALSSTVGPAFVAVVMHNHGLVLAQSGRVAESMRQFDAAEQSFTEAGLPLGEHYFEHAEVLADLRLLPEARALSERAAQELENHDVPLMAAEARLAVAQIALFAGDHGTALDSARRASDLFRRHRRPVWVARAAIVSALAVHANGDAVGRSDFDAVRRAASVLRQRGIQSGAVEAAIAAGRLADGLGLSMVARRWLWSAHRSSRGGTMLVRLRGELAAALAARSAKHDQALLSHCRAGLADLARHRAALASAELRVLASGHGVELGRLGLEVLLRSGAPIRIFEWMERTRAAALLAVERPAPAVVRDERAALAMVYAEIVEARRDSGVEPGPLLRRQRDLEGRVRRAVWQQQASGSVGATARAPEIRALLGEQVLVSFGEDGGGAFFAVVLERRRTRFVPLGELDEVRFERDGLLFALRRLTRPGRTAALDSARASAEHALRRLAAMLVAPLGLPSTTPLIVVPTAELNRIPWSALHTAPVTVVPSASTWLRSHRVHDGSVPTVLVVAGPDLPGAEKEMDAVASLHPGATVLDPRAATMEAVVGALARADLVHLACHGYLRTDNPTFSALQLADGQLTVHELDLRGIAPQRIVLAVCDSAADVSYDGDELLGFVSALLGRGTAGLVAGVVSVGDIEAVELMTALHRHVRDGDSFAVALNRARSGLDLRDPRQFVNWCAFTAYGAG